MQKYMKYVFFFLLISKISMGQTIGLQQYDLGNKPGYILFAPINSNSTFLIDKCGDKIHEWHSEYHPGLTVYLLADGNLLRTENINSITFANGGGRGGGIELMDWNSKVIWSYQISDTTQLQHHDIAQLPNGNILAIVWDRRTKEEAIKMGRNPTNLGKEFWSEKIVELQPTGKDSANIVWEWKAWDHLDQDFDSSIPNFDTISRHPELININYFSHNPKKPDWLHINAIDYNPATDQILLSVHNFDEIWVIDHSTTTTQAASHSGGKSGKGGDLLYRWGNPQTYNRGVASDQKLFGQHDAHWIKPGLPNAGKIIIFNNGNGRPDGSYSSIDIIKTPLDSSNTYPIGDSASYLPSTLFWSYTASIPTDFFSKRISGVQVLSNGSMLICSGPTGTFFEIDSSKNTIWKYINPVNIDGPMSQGSTPTGNAVFRCSFYEPSFKGFTGHNLAPGSEIELNPIYPSICDSISSGINDIFKRTQFFISPNPSHNYLKLSIRPFQNNLVLYLFDWEGKLLLNSKIDSSKFSVNLSLFPPGIYLLKITNGKEIFTYKFIKE